MLFTIYTVTAILGLSATLTAAAPTAKRVVDFSPFPLSDGFPNPSTAQVKQIEQQALGTLPNGSPPPTISKEGITNLQVIALNELFEVAFFTELLTNVTNNVAGYEVKDHSSREFLIAALTAVQAQEQLHLLNANGALAHFNATPIQPCSYNFPVSDLNSAIDLASTFTSVVLGTLQDVIEIFASNNDAALTRGVASVIGQEGEQEGFYRSLLGKVPSELPFLTTSTRDFAVNALNQTFFVPGSCPNLDIIDVLTFEPLTLLTSITQAKTQNVQFSFELFSGVPTKADAEKLSLVYINQQNTPILTDFQVVNVQGQTVTIEASFPYDQNLMNGLTIAALADGNATSLTSADLVSSATKFGPALIIVN